MPGELPGIGENQAQLDYIYFGGELTAGGDLTFIALDTLTLADFQEQPLNLSGQNINLSGNAGLFFDLTNDPSSEIKATQNVALQSNNWIGRVGGGKITADENITFTAPQITLQGAQLDAGQKLTFDAPDLLQFESFLGSDGLRLFTAIAPEIDISPSAEVKVDLALSNIAIGQLESDSNLTLSSTGNLFASGNIASNLGSLSLTAAGDIELVQTTLSAQDDLTNLSGRSPL